MNKHHYFALPCRSFTGKGQSVFCQFEDDENFEEYYDLDSDPWQLINLALSLGEEELTVERSMLADLAKCKGKECQKYNYDNSGSSRANFTFITWIFLILCIIE